MSRRRKWLVAKNKRRGSRILSAAEQRERRAAKAAGLPDHLKIHAWDEVEAELDAGRSTQKDGRP